MADSPLIGEGLPIAGKWGRDKLKGCESTQVLEPSRRNKEIWEKRVIFPYSLDNKTFAFGEPKPLENNRNKETISFFPSYSNCSPRTFISGTYNFSYLKPPNKIFRSAPTIVEGYLAWLDRVQQAFGSLWKDFGIFDFIQLSRLGIKYQQEMIIAVLHFFESSTNTFQFECGLMTPTLFDVAAITGLSPTGDTYDPTLAGSKIEPKIRTKSYTKYIEEHNQLTGEVSDEEHVAFLVLWLSQHRLPNAKSKGVRLARLIPRTRGLTYQQLFLQYFEAFLGLKEFKERFAPIADRQVGPSWFIHPFPPLPESEEYQNAVWSAFLTPTVISCRFGLKSTEFGLVGYFPKFVSRQFGLTQLLPKTIYLHERDICLGYYGMTEPQFYALLKKFEGLEYELTPFHFELSHAHIVDFHRWWNLHYESQMVDVVVLRSAIEAGINAQAIRKIKSTLNARGSRSKAESDSLAKPPFPPVKTEPGATTRKRAATAEASGPSKKARPVETVFIDDDDVLRRKRKHEQPAPILEETQTVPSEKEEKKKKKKKKKDKDSKSKECPSQDVAPTGGVSIQKQAPPLGEEQTEKKKKKKKKKDKKSQSQSDLLVTTSSKPTPEVNEGLVNQETSVDPDLSPVKTSTPHSPKNTNLGQGDPSPTVLVPEISPDSIVKTIVSELNQQLEQAGEGELSPTTRTVEGTRVPTQVVMSISSETSPPNASVDIELTVEAGSSKAGGIKDPGNLLRETLSTIPEQPTPKNSNEVDPEVVGTSKTKDLDSNGAEGKTTENVDTQASKDEDPASDAAQHSMIEPSRPLGDDNAEVVKVAENVEEELSNQGEHSSTRDHHPPKSGNKDDMYEDTDDFLNSSAGYARTAKTGDSIEDDGTSVSKPTSDIFLPSHILQSVKNLTPEEALDTLLKTYGNEVPIAEEDKQKLEEERKGLELHFQKIHTVLNASPQNDSGSSACDNKHLTLSTNDLLILSATPFQRGDL
ncbi:hypothetical protein TSUD_365500 [Trifolium subterraneum]|uniref:Aminotransferase-like plant mobile domain-containing protein n=1 Tax=Trifolium subterraneum TaxID=3900 RepID=A0A2Z6MM84_TRISU|nr:hypothetical protein TSUD_365500 [Trifolium subterraneum]